MKVDASPANLMPLMRDSALSDHPMQVILQPLLSSEGGSVQIDTNSKAILSSLISTYCTQKGIKFDAQYTIYDEKKRPLPMYSTLSALGIENGQTLLIGKEDTSFSVIQQWPIVVALATIAIGLIGILSLSLVYGLKGGEYFDDYGVVMDAGSSKTNTIVYKWKSNKYRGTGRVSQENNCYARGGIAKMNPTHLEPVINCAKNVTSVIAPESLSKTPLYLAATAGMRLLRLTNPERADQIFETLHRELPETHLDVKEIEIISGMDEGIYGWITTNFLLKTLEIPQKLDPWEPSTFGALDMGGASMQIAYALPKKASDTHLEDVRDVHLYGQTHHVFAHSNLCFGRDEASNRYKALLLRSANGTIVLDPCSPRGYVENATSTKLLESICTKSTLDPQKVEYSFVGTSDPANCQKKVADLLDDDLCKTLNFKECFKKQTNVPDNQNFLAFATYFYTTNFLNITNVTLKGYEEAVQAFCSKDLAEIQKLKNDFALQYCFNAQYIYQALTNGFGFTEDTWKKIRFVDKISGKDVGWTLGYMINATNIIPEKATPRLISATSLSVSLVLFIIIILATALFLLYTYKKSRSNTF